MSHNKLGEEIISADPEMPVNHPEFYKRSPLARELRRSTLKRPDLLHVLTVLLFIGIGVTWYAQHINGNNLVGSGRGSSSGISVAEGRGRSG